MIRINTGTTVLGAKDVYKSDWFAFKSFSFLMDKDEPRETMFSGQTDNVSIIKYVPISRVGHGWLKPGCLFFLCD